MAAAPAVSKPPSPQPAVSPSNQVPPTPVMRSASLSVAPAIPTAAKAAVASPVISKLPTPPQAQATANAMSPKPPQTVTALSSVSANTLPPGAGATPTPTPAAPAPEPDVEFAKPKGSIGKLVPLLIGGLLFILVAVFAVMWFVNRDTSAGSGTTPKPTSATGAAAGGTAGGAAGNATAPAAGQQVVLQYWGLWEPGETMQQVIADFQKINPTINVQYVKQSDKDYRTRLQNALVSGNGPDIFRFHAAWVPMIKNDLAPLPSAVMSASDYQKTFYPVASSQLQVNGTPVGIPLMYEGLALFYNVDILNTAVVQPPKTWSELQATAQTLTVSEGGVIKRAGVALGNATNVENFSDIVALLMLQNGADFTQPNSAETRDALLFYTKFIKDNIWNDSLPSSSVAFARGDAAMIFAPSWRAHEIKQMNPSLNFATVSVPQLSGTDKITWANYWAEGVSVKGKYQKEAWQFLKYLSTKEVQQQLYAAQSETRSFGEIYSRIDAADTLVADKTVGAFVLDAPKATGWYMSSNTHDAGINDEIIEYYANAVNGLVAGKSSEEVLQTLESGVKQVLQKYGVPTSSTTK